MLDIQGTLREFIVAEKPQSAPNGAGANGIAARTFKRVRPRHRMVVALHHAGWSNDAIAEALGYTSTRVSIIIQSTHPELQRLHKTEQIRARESVDDVVAKFKSEAMASVETLVEIRDDPEVDASQRRLSAVGLLDRAGYSPVRKNMNVDVKVPIEDLKRVADRIVGADEVVAASGAWRIAPIQHGAK